jgi:hypothetical protein
MMRVLVAIRTLTEGDAGIPWLGVVTVGVTLRAQRLRMQAGERIPCSRMVELPDADRLPILVVVT